MLEAAAVLSEVFDEDFFAYREDADLAWRAQLLGWTSVYVPAARARHRRRVTPERRTQLPMAINRASVRNRFLLRLKNQTWGHALRFLVPALARDAQVVGYVLLREWTSLGSSTSRGCCRGRSGTADHHAPACAPVRRDLPAGSPLPR
jgi:GT2 family glycosyltransferase